MENIKKQGEKIEERIIVGIDVNAINENVRIDSIRESKRFQEPKKNFWILECANKKINIGRDTIIVNFVLFKSMLKYASFIV